jgi:23S rRNA pseudouridine2605 synthase
VDGRAVRFAAASRGAGAPRLLLYHKPAGEIVSRDDPRGRPTVFDRLPEVADARWVAVGRLDFNTSGLLLFTDSGELAHRLMHPSFGMKREYAVRVMGRLSEEQMERLRRGVTLEDGPARFDVLEEAGGSGANRWYRAVLDEGRNREVRRMFASAGMTVSRLIRVAFGDMKLPRGLRQGRYIEVPGEEVQALLSSPTPPGEQIGD